MMTNFTWVNLKPLNLRQLNYSSSPSRLSTLRASWRFEVVSLFQWLKRLSGIFNEEAERQLEFSSMFFSQFCSCQSRVQVLEARNFCRRYPRSLCPKGCRFIYTVKGVNGGSPFFFLFLFFVLTKPTQYGKSERWKT